MVIGYCFVSRCSLEYCVAGSCFAGEHKRAIGVLKRRHLSADSSYGRFCCVLVCYNGSVILGLLLYSHGIETSPTLRYCEELSPTGEEENEEGTYMTAQEEQEQRQRSQEE